MRALFLTLRIMLMADKNKTKDLVPEKCYQEALFLLGVDPQTELIVIHHKTSSTIRVAFKKINYRKNEN